MRELLLSWTLITELEFCELCAYLTSKTSNEGHRQDPNMRLLWLQRSQDIKNDDARRPIDTKLQQLNSETRRKGKTQTWQVNRVGGDYPLHCNSYLCSLKRSNAEMRSEATVFTWWRENWDWWGRTEVKPMAESIHNHLREHRRQAEWQRRIYIKHLHHCDWQQPLWFRTNGVFIFTRTWNEALLRSWQCWLIFYGECVPNECT